MERLGDDELIAVAKKVAEFGTHYLTDFLFTSKDIARICKLPIVLQSLPLIMWIGSTMMTSQSIKLIFST